MLYKGSFLKVKTSTKCDYSTFVCVYFVYASSSVFQLGLSCC